MRSKGVVLERKCKTKSDQFSISFRSPHLWNKLVANNPIFTQTEQFSSFEKMSKSIYQPLKIFSSFSNLNN